MRNRTGSKATLIYLHRPIVLSSAVQAVCSVCGRGVDDDDGSGGDSTITARAVPGVGTRMFCDIHCP